MLSSPDLIGGSRHKNSKIPYRDPRVKPEDDIVGNFDGILDGILNEIASVALLPRNDGIPYFCAICILLATIALMAILPNLALSFVFRPSRAVFSLSKLVAL